MEINDYTLSQIHSDMDNTLQSYSKELTKTGMTKELVSSYQRRLNEKIAYQEKKLKELTTPNDANYSSAVLLATSKDSGLIKQAMKDGIDKRNFSLAIALGNLVINSTSYSNADRFEVKRLLADAKHKSGYFKEDDTLKQCYVVKETLDTFDDLAGTDEIKEVLNKVNMKRSTAEMKYVLDKEKQERTLTPTE